MTVSMGTLHSNSPRECISRLESMIMMGGFNLPSRTIREMIVGSVDIIVQRPPDCAMDRARSPMSPK